MVNARPSRAASFAASIPRAVRRSSGATLLPRTPLNVRTARVELDETTRAYGRQRSGAKLAARATGIERVTARYEDVNGPRGRVDAVCRVKVVVSRSPSVLFEAPAETGRAASDLAFSGVARKVRRALA